MEPKRLYRARDDRWIAGVCGGLGRFFSIDPTPIRLGFIVLSLWRGFGVLLYLIMLLVIPEEPTTQVVTDPHIPQEHGQEDPQARRYRILGVILLLGGVYLLMQNLTLPQTVEWAVAVLLILVGFVILLLRPGRI